jgi:hypothetical protein
VDTTLWLLLAGASACSMVSAFGSSLRIGMSRLDAAELRRRRHMIQVLEANAQLLTRRHDAPAQPPDGAGDAGRELSAATRLRGHVIRACRSVYVRFGG